MKLSIKKLSLPVPTIQLSKSIKQRIEESRQRRAQHRVMERYKAQRAAKRQELLDKLLDKYEAEELDSMAEQYDEERSVVGIGSQK